MFCVQKVASFSDPLDVIISQGRVYTPIATVEDVAPFQMECPPTTTSYCNASFVFPGLQPNQNPLSLEGHGHYTGWASMTHWRVELTAGGLPLANSTVEVYITQLANSTLHVPLFESRVFNVSTLDPTVPELTFTHTPPGDLWRSVTLGLTPICP